VDADRETRAYRLPGEFGYGVEVAISGDIIVVGADVPFYNFGPGDYQYPPGAAYVYRRNGKSWTLQTKLTRPTRAPEDNFGSHVAIDGNTIVIGGETDTVYAYFRNGSTWALQGTLAVPYGGAEFSTSTVDISGNSIIVGPSGLGDAFVYVRNGTTWSLQSTLHHYTSYEGQTFVDVKIQGDIALVGVPDAANVNGVAVPSHATVFVRNAGVWSFQSELTPPADVRSFADILSLEGGRAIISAGIPSAGPTHSLGIVYTRNGVTWSQSGRLEELDAACGFAFSGTTGIVDHCADDTGGTDAGAADIYTLVQDTTAAAPRVDAATGDNFLNLKDTQTGIAITGGAEATMKVTLGKVTKTVTANSAGA
jgi:hypothetical protein